MSIPIEVLQNRQVLQGTSVAKKINKYLNSSKTRIKGLRLLKFFLPQCPEKDFLQFCLSWMQNCCKVDSLPKSRDYAIYLLSDLLKISSNYQELKKSVSFFITTRYFDYFFKYLLNSQAGWCCTESCLLLYRGACGLFQSSLEKHLKNEIKKNMKISFTLGSCVALIPCIGGAGNESSNYKKNWRNQFIIFLNACHSILNDLFADVDESEKFVTHKQWTLDNNIENKSPEYLTVQLYNHSVVLSCMLLNQYPVAKAVPSDLIFQFICKWVALYPKVLGRHKIARIISVKKVLPEIQCSLFFILKAVIVTCKNQLLPYSQLICKLIKQILEWTESDFTYANIKSFEDVRILAYETFCEWLIVSGNGSCANVISNTIVMNAFNDIKSKKKVVFLKETKIQNQFEGREEAISPTCSIGSRRLCHAALKALKFLLRYAGISLKSDEHKFLQEMLVKLVVEVQRSTPQDLSALFCISSCRRELYFLLLELICQPSPKWPPPTNYALRLFSKGINDPSPEVSSLCSAALNFTSLIIHSQYDNGGFPPSETPGDRNETEVEFFWKRGEEPMEFERTKEADISVEKSLPGKEKFSESDKTNHFDTLNDLREESDVSCDEDTRSTVKFLKVATESDKSIVDVDENKANELSAQIYEVDSEPETKKQRILEEELTPAKAPTTPIQKDFLDNNLVKDLQEISHSKSIDESQPLEKLTCLKDVSAESINEDGQHKVRYFLRSKTKGSSEEPEDASKKTSSSEILKYVSTKSLSKNTRSPQNSKKRPRTRELSKLETGCESQPKTLEKREHEDDNGNNGKGRADEEDIKAAFDDSFID